MVTHYFKVISKVVKELNRQQPTFIIADQPVYAIAKQVQWLLPDEYKNVVVLMDPLHIKMAFLNAISDWLKGSGWVTIFERAHMTSVGRIDADTRIRYPWLLLSSKQDKHLKPRMTISTLVIGRGTAVHSPQP